MYVSVNEPNAKHLPLGSTALLVSWSGRCYMQNSKIQKIGNMISILYGVDWTVWMDIYSRVICMSIRRLPQLYFRSRIGSLCRNGMLLQSPLL